MRQLLKVTCLKSFEDNFGRVETPIGVAMRRAGELIPHEDLQRQHPRYLGFLERNGYVRVERLTHCPTCGSAIPVAEETPAFNNVAT